ncbi:hypothetical protein [Sedimentitalea sp.]|uniref:hypothetical protein n=1 Tax=Sedimentitalea sp. TaxID=2048915 RepID=UPI003298463F
MRVDYEDYYRHFDELSPEQKVLARDLMRKAIWSDDARVILSAYNMSLISNYYIEDRTEKKHQAWLDIMRRSGVWMPVGEYPDFGKSMRGIMDDTPYGYHGLLKMAFDQALNASDASSLKAPSIILNAAADLLPPGFSTAVSVLSDSLDLVETDNGRVSMGPRDEDVSIWNWMALATVQQAARDGRFKKVLLDELETKLDFAALDLLPDDEGTILNNDMIANLKKRFAGISAKIDTNASDVKDVQDDVQQISDSFQAIVTELAKRQKAEQLRETELKNFQYLRGETVGLMSLVGLFIKDPEQKRKFSTFSSALITSIDLVRETKLYMANKGTMGPLALASGWVGVGMAVVSIFSPAQEPQDIKLLKAIYEEIVALRQEVKEGFDLIDKQLGSLSAVINLLSTQNQLNFQALNDSLKDLKSRLDEVFLEFQFIQLNMNQDNLDDHVESLKRDLSDIDRRANERLSLSKSNSEFDRSMQLYFEELMDHASDYLIKLKDASVVLPASARAAIDKFNIRPGDRRLLDLLGPNMLWNFSILLYVKDERIKIDSSEGRTIITFPVCNPYLWATYTRELCERLNSDPNRAQTFHAILSKLHLAGKEANWELMSLCDRKATYECFQRFGNVTASVYGATVSLVDYYDSRIIGPHGSTENAWHAVRGRWTSKITSGLGRPMRNEEARGHVSYFNNELTCRRNVEPRVVAPPRAIKGVYYFPVSQFEDLVDSKIRDLNQNLRISGYGELYIVANNFKIPMNPAIAVRDGKKRNKTDGILGDGLAHYSQRYSFTHRILLGRPLPIYVEQHAQLIDQVMQGRFYSMIEDGIYQNPIAVTADDTAEDRVDLPIFSSGQWLAKVKPITDDDAVSMIVFALKNLKGHFNLSEGMDGVLDLQARILTGQEVFYGKLPDVVSAGLRSPAKLSAPAMIDDKATSLAEDVLLKIIESRRTLKEFRARAMPEMERGGPASEQLIAVLSMFSENNVINTDLTKVDDEATRILALDYGYIMGFEGASENFLSSVSSENLASWFDTYFHYYPPQFGTVPFVLGSLKLLENTLTPRGYGS